MTSSLVLEEIDSILPADFQGQYDALIGELKAILAERPAELETLMTHLFKGRYRVFDKELGVVSTTLYIHTRDVEGVVLNVTKGLTCVGQGHDQDAISREVGKRIMARWATYRAFRLFARRWTEFVELHGGPSKLGYLAKHERFPTGV